MLTSANSTFSNNQAITASAASTNVLDLGAAGTPVGAAAALAKDLGKGTKIPFLVQVTADFATLTSLTITLQKDTVENFASPETVVAHTVAVADLVAGYQIPIDVLPIHLDQRYVRLYYTVTGGDATAGTIFAAITMGNQQNP